MDSKNKPVDMGALASLMSSMAEIKAYLKMIHGNQQVLISELLKQDPEHIKTDQKNTLEQLIKNQKIADFNALSEATGMEAITEEYLDSIGKRKHKAP